MHRRYGAGIVARPGAGARRTRRKGGDTRRRREPADEPQRPATIANLAPPNLVHFVVNNGAYEVNGNFPIPGNRIVNFAGLAREAGYAAAFEFSELADFEAKIEEILDMRGPVFVCLKAEPGDDYPKDYAIIHSAESRQIFRGRVAG